MVTFLYSKQNTLSKELCEEFISTFEKSELKNNFDSRLGDGSIHKKATEIYFYDSLNAEWLVKEKHLWYDLLFDLNNIIIQNYDSYCKEYPQLNMTPPLECISFNLQKYNPGEGFANWHFDSVYENSKRVLVWMIYLNDVEDGGTEFKYQEHVEKAIQGKFLIWPADWTFVHRGEVSYTKTKYILTGWFTEVDHSKFDFPK